METLTEQQYLTAGGQSSPVKDSSDTTAHKSDALATDEDDPFFGL